MATIKVRKGSKQKVSNNFTQDELHSNSSDAPIEHEVDENLVNAVQYLRDLFGAYRTHGTGRTPKHNKRVGGASKSKHLEFNPVVAHDGSFLKDNAKNISKIADDIINEGSIYEDLKYIGVKGIGFYDWGIHIDTSLTRNQFTVWDNRTKKKNEFPEINEDTHVGTGTTLKKLSKLAIGFLLFIAFKRVSKYFKLF